MHQVKQCSHNVSNRYFTPSADRFTTSTTTVVFFVYQSYWNKKVQRSNDRVPDAFAEKKTKVSYVVKKAPALTMQSRLHCICGP